MFDALIIGIIVFSANILVLFLAYRTLIRILQAYLQPPDDKTPAEWTKVVDTLAHRIVGVAMESLKMTELQSKGVEARNERKLEAAMVTDLAGKQNPIAGLLLQLPQVKAIIQKNPDLIETAMSIFARRFGAIDNTQVMPGGNNRPGEEVKFGL